MDLISSVESYVHWIEIVKHKSVGRDGGGRLDAPFIE